MSSPVRCCKQRQAKILLIDSTKGILDGVTSLHVRNSKVLQQWLGAELTDSSGIDPSLLREYDAIVFVHASGYTNVQGFRGLIEKNLKSRFYFIKNEYNLGEPVILWDACKNSGLRYTMIANYDSAGLGKYILSWHTVNLNALIFTETTDEDAPPTFLDLSSLKSDIVYYGSWRKDRAKYFSKYFGPRMVVSTSAVNRAPFMDISTDCTYIEKVQWTGTKQTLRNFRASLYIEDEYTHTHFNFLANRFYESLMYRVPCFFDQSCENTIRQAGYPINTWYIVNSYEELCGKLDTSEWPDYGFEALRARAIVEKREVLERVAALIQNRKPPYES